MSERPEDEEWNAFESAAHAKGWKCKYCEETITLADKEVFFESGCCSRCHWKLTND